MIVLKINVLIVTYKQAKVIGRAIESILLQKDYGLNKIILCDDCSPDNNWEIIQEYINKYPDYLEAYRNETNLGIYGNSNKLMSLRGDADLYCWLEGDDALCPNFFMTVQENEQSFKIDKRIAIMSNFIYSNANGSEIVDTRNRIVIDRKDYFSLYIRGLVSWRASLFSASVLDCFKPAILNQGLSLAESTFDCQFFTNLDIAYYLPVNGSIYYAGIGVSVDLQGETNPYNSTEREIQWEYYINNLICSKKDLLWSKANLIRCRYYKKPTIALFFKACYNYFVGMIPTYRITRKSMISFIYPMLRRVLSR